MRSKQAEAKIEESWQSHALLAESNVLHIERLLWGQDYNLLERGTFQHSSNTYPWVSKHLSR